MNLEACSLGGQKHESGSSLPPTNSHPLRAGVTATSHTQWTWPSRGPWCQSCLVREAISKWPLSIVSRSKSLLLSFRTSDLRFKASPVTFRGPDGSSPRLPREGGFVSVKKPPAPLLLYKLHQEPYLLSATGGRGRGSREGGGWRDMAAGPTPPPFRGFLGFEDGKVRPSPAPPDSLRHFHI